MYRTRRNAVISLKCLNFYRKCNYISQQNVPFIFCLFFAGRRKRLFVKPQRTYIYIKLNHMSNIDAIFKSRPSMYWEQGIEGNNVMEIFKWWKIIRVLFAT